MQFTFEENEEGWEFSYPVGFFDPIEGTHSLEGGSLNVFVTNSNSFGFWERDGIDTSLVTKAEARQSDSLFRARFTMSSSVNPQLAPVVRMRTSSEDFQRSDLLVATSTQTGDFSPGTQPRGYLHFFEQPAGADALRTNFDVLSFDPADASNATLSLQSVVIDVVSKSNLANGLDIAIFDFAGNGALNFTPRDAAPALVAPEVYDVANGLRIRGIDPETHDGSSYPGTIFGYWGLEAQLGITGNRLYRLTWHITSTATEANNSQLPTFRMRVNDRSLNFSSLTNIDSVNATAEIPTAAIPRSYEQWFFAPAEVDGNDIIFSFDYLYVNKEGLSPDVDDPELGITLQRLDVTTFDLPVAK